MKLNLLEYFQPEPPVVLSERYSLVEKLEINGIEQTFIAKDLHAPGHPDCIVRQFHLPEAPARNTLHLEAVRELFQSEVKRFSLLQSHSCVPQRLAHFEVDGDFYFVEEKIEGHTLAEELVSPVPWSDQRVVALLNDLLSTLDYLHQNRIVHLNLQPKTLVRRQEDSRWALVEFGSFQQAIARIVTPGPSIRTPPAFNTSLYMPDEQVAGHPQPSSDIYAAGLIAIQALTGRRPETIPSHPQTGEFYWQSLASLRHPALKALLDYLVRYNFRTRCQTTAEALAALSALPPEVTWFSPTTTKPEEEQIASAVEDKAIEANLNAESSAPFAVPVLPDTDQQPPRQAVQATDRENARGQRATRKPIFRKSVLPIGAAIVALLGASALLVWRLPSKLLVADSENAAADRPSEPAADQLSSSDSNSPFDRPFANNTDRATDSASNAVGNDATDNTANTANTALDEEAIAQMQERPSGTVAIGSSQVGATSALAPEAAKATVGQFYNFVSNRSWDSARSLLSDRMSAQLEPDFFDQFQDVSVENMRVVSQTPEIADLVVQNTYVYSDGSYQQEERNYTVQLVGSQPKIVDTAFVEVIRDRNY